MVDSTLLHAGELGTALSLDAARRIEAVHMRWLRKATGHYRAIAEDRMCDEAVRVTYEVPSTRSLLLVRRLTYLASLQKGQPLPSGASPTSRSASPVGRYDSDGSCWFQALEPKLSGLPSPYHDIDAWVRFACDHPRAWRRLLRVLRTPSDPDAFPSAFVECPVCAKVVAARGLGSHCAKSHQFVRLARFYCDDSGVCLVCHVRFPSRPRCIHHIHHSKPECLRQLEAGACVMLDIELVRELDAADAKLRLTARKAGISYLTVSVSGLGDASA